MSTETVPRSARGAYRPFPNLAHRNALQASLEIPTLVRLLRLPAERRILEVGCGRGVALAPLARLCRPARLVGLDVDAALLREAAAALEPGGVRVELVHGDVRGMPFPEGSFDVVVDFGTCYHVDRPEWALAEIERVLTPGGLFVHETPVGQLFAHPVRSLGRTLPWRTASRLVRKRHAVLWASEQKQDTERRAVTTGPDPEATILTP